MNKKALKTWLHEGHPSLEKLHFLTAIVLAFLIPCHRQLLPYAIGMMALSWIVEGAFARKYRQVFVEGALWRRFLFLLLFAFFLLHLIGLLYTQNIDQGLSIVQLRMSFLAFPVIFSTANSWFVKRRQVLLKAFILGCFTASIGMLIHAVYQSFYFEGSFYIFDPNPYKYLPDSYFSYHFFTIYHQASYFAMFLVMAIVCLAVLWHSHKLTPRERTASVVLVFFFLLILYLTASRSGFLSLAVVFVGALFFFLLKKWPAWLLSVLVAFSLLLLALTISNIKAIDKQLSDYILRDSNNTQASLGYRMNIWPVAWDMAQEKIFWGYGTGDSKQTLLLEYQKRNMDELAQRHLNAHNQFLELLLRFGILGLVMQFAVFISVLLLAIRHRQELLWLFCLIILTNFFFESIFNRLSGVLFYSFFMCLLVFIPIDRVSK